MAQIEIRMPISFPQFQLSLMQILKPHSCSSHRLSHRWFSHTLAWLLKLSESYKRVETKCMYPSIPASPHPYLPLFATAMIVTAVVFLFLFSTPNADIAPSCGWNSCGTHFLKSLPDTSDDFVWLNIDMCNFIASKKGTCCCFAGETGRMLTCSDLDHDNLSHP